MRWKVLEIFAHQLSQVERDFFDNVAVVGGNSQEPELAFINFRNVEYFGIQSDPACSIIQMDLNVSLGAPPHIGTFELVLCSQVLEHVYDVKQAIHNLAQLVAVGGYLWIACPASNYPHGSPEYFSAGYVPELITRLLNPLGFEIIFAEKYGSPRMYFFTHALQYWPTQREYLFPLRFKISRYFFHDLLNRLVAMAKSPKFGSELHYATETIVFARKLRKSVVKKIQ